MNLQTHPPHLLASFHRPTTLLTLNKPKQNRLVKSTSPNGRQPVI